MKLSSILCSTAHRTSDKPAHRPRRCPGARAGRHLGGASLEGYHIKGSSRRAAHSPATAGSRSGLQLIDRLVRAAKPLAELSAKVGQELDGNGVVLARQRREAGLGQQVSSSSASTLRGPALRRTGSPNTVPAVKVARLGTAHEQAPESFAFVAGECGQQTGRSALPNDPQRRCELHASARNAASSSRLPSVMGQERR
jgi:hypothetical protein